MGDIPGQAANHSDLQSPGARPSVILVVDDDALFRKLITLLMRLDGHFVISAANGREGLELSRQYPESIDLVITDVEMPRLNGTDLCAHLLEERPGIKVLAMSSADMNELGNPSADLPFLPKPFDPEALRARVRAMLAAPVQPPVQALQSDAAR
jgi:DNA-binding response OmpR family regulator